MNTETVTVYSTADKEVLHIQFVDYAVCIGGPRANDSCLNMRNILSAVCMTACDTIHPGLGFLNENAKFARLVPQCSLVFIGPNPDMTEQIGDKSNTRRCMMEAGVPVIPSSKGLLETVQDVVAMAEKIGYPVPTKVSSGGGGRRMRRADYAEELVDAFDTAKAEARANFGDDAVHMRELIVELKHVEVQLIADKYGNVVHLYERNCSCQRRSQKLPEEAPCHILEEDVHEHPLRDTVRTAENVGYDSVGAIESLLDARGEYYFMEMSIRTQVEHTISEGVCGIDLTKQRVRITDGHKLAYRQENIARRNHTIECRINAKNIRYNFTPGSRQTSFIDFPLGRRVYIEGAVYSDYNIPSYHGSMAVRIITYVDAHLEYIRRMHSVLGELLIEGVETNVEFQHPLLHHPASVDGRYNTGSMGSFIKGLKEDGTII